MKRKAITLAIFGALILLAQQPTNQSQIGGSTVVNGVCGQAPWTFYAVNVSSETQVAAGSSGKIVNVCRLSFPPQANAVNISFTESATSGNACGTSPTALYGSGTTTTAFNIAANGGFIDPPNTFGQPLFATASGDALCIDTSAQISGGIWYVQQ